MSLFPFVAKAVLPAASFFGIKLWWRWRSFKRDVAKFRQRAVELHGREARRIARTGLLELAEGAAKERDVYRFFTRVMAKQVLREVIADVREATRHREQAFAAGCNECVSKPVDFQLLEDMLGRFLPTA